MSWRFMLIAFAAGGAIKLFDDLVRRDQLDLALNKSFNRDESQRLEELLAERSVYDRWVLTVSLFVSPRRAALRFRRLLMEDETQRDESKGL